MMKEGGMPMKVIPLCGEPTVPPYSRPFSIRDG